MNTRISVLVAFDYAWYKLSDIATLDNAFYIDMTTKNVHENKTAPRILLSLHHRMQGISSIGMLNAPVSNEVYQDAISNNELTELLSNDAYEMQPVSNSKNQSF